MALEERDLKLLINELVDVSHKWKEIGRHLGVTGLEVIEYNHPGDAVKCLEAMLKRWLSNDEESSWGKVVRTLEAVQEEPRARELGLKYLAH